MFLANTEQTYGRGETVMQGGRYVTAKDAKCAKKTATGTDSRYRFRRGADGAPADRKGYGVTAAMNVPQFAANTPGGSETRGGLMASVAIQMLPLSSETAAE